MGTQKKQRSSFNNLLDKESSTINTTRHYCFPEIIASLPNLLKGVY